MRENNADKVHRNNLECFYCRNRNIAGDYHAEFKSMVKKIILLFGGNPSRQHFIMISMTLSL